MTTALLKDFNAVINNFHSVLEVIRDEVTQTARATEYRDPATLLPIYSSGSPSSSTSLAPAKLCQALKDLSLLSGKVCSYAIDPTEYLALIFGSFYESIIALRVVSQLDVADAIGDGQISL